MAFRAPRAPGLDYYPRNDALSVLIRLEEMGVNKYMALSSTVALYSQYSPHHMSVVQIQRDCPRADYQGSGKAKQKYSNDTIVKATPAPGRC